MQKDNNTKIKYVALTLITQISVHGKRGRSRVKLYLSKRDTADRQLRNQFHDDEHVSHLLRIVERDI